MANEVRQNKIAEAILREISSCFITEYSGTPLSTVTITHVAVSRDLRNATVYYALFNQADIKTVQSELDRESKKLRFRVGSKISHLKSVPELSFKYDNIYDQSMKLESIFSKIKEEKDEGDEN